MIETGHKFLVLKCEMENSNKIKVNWFLFLSDFYLCLSWTYSTWWNLCHVDEMLCAKNGFEFA